MSLIGFRMATVRNRKAERHGLRDNRSAVPPGLAAMRMSR